MFGEMEFLMQQRIIMQGLTQFIQLQINRNFIWLKENILKLF